MHIAEQNQKRADEEIALKTQRTYANFFPDISRFSTHANQNGVPFAPVNNTAGALVSRRAPATERALYVRQP